MPDFWGYEPKDYEWIRVPKEKIPAGVILRECYETPEQIIVCGTPQSDDETHNCDAMGCTSVNCTLYRFDKASGKEIRTLWNEQYINSKGIW